MSSLPSPCAEALCSPFEIKGKSHCVGMEMQCTFQCWNRLHSWSALSLQLKLQRGFPDGSGGKEPGCQCRRWKRCRFNPCVRKIPWRKEWLTNPIFLPGEFHGQRNLVSYSPWDSRVSDTTEQLTLLLLLNVQNTRQMENTSHPNTKKGEFNVEKDTFNANYYNLQWLYYSYIYFWTKTM